MLPIGNNIDPMIIGASSGVLSISATSPATPTTAVMGSPITGLGIYESLNIAATIQGATGGTLDLYLQTSPDGGTTWVDYIHFAQLAAAAAQSTKVVTVSCGVQSTGITAVGTGLTPSLAASTVVGGAFGDRMRLVAVSGAGTTVGAVQTILISGKS
jgi:hypothetical protein